MPNQGKKGFAGWEELLCLVEKPGRYTGGEINSVVKEKARCRFALAFPDVYEIAMSHLGIQILYSILNRDPDIAAELVFAPWPDMEAAMRASGAKLGSLETRTPLAGFDVVGFSLQYELGYTNVLGMLDLGGIEFFAAKREEDSPLVVAGGPCVFNPEPMADFIDAFAVGEGEESVLEIARTVMEGKEKGWSRRRKLEALASLEGVYVPSVHTHGEIVRKRTVADLNAWSCPERPVVPLVQAVHDRINLEIARGCTRGCRFCQAGMVWRPVRERNPGVLHDMASRMLASTGCEEISLLSLSSGDYTFIQSFLPDLMDRYYGKRVAISLPSLRVESLTPRLIEAIKRVRKTSFTLAPEAGTERLRRIINKGNTEEDLIATADRVFSAGWKLIKLYFMLGLPGETEEDLEGIIDLSFKVLRHGGNRRQVNVSLSTFVPKPHTPFQWHRQIGPDEVLEKQEFFKKRLRNRNLVFKWHDRRMSLLEGILSRGDRAVGAVIASAFRNGCRFDGWSDLLRFDGWQKALEDNRLDIDRCLRQRRIDEALPWDRIDCGVAKSFLIEEYEKSFRGEPTVDCRSGACGGCGACDEKVKTVSASGSEENAPGEPPSRLAAKKSVGAVVDGYRLRFVKEGRMRFLSHLETASALVRGIRRAGIVFEHTQGFHPHPRISFAFASPVGTESRSEYADIQIYRTGKSPAEMISAINLNLPSGLSIADIKKIPPGASLFKAIRGFRYEMVLPEDVWGRSSMESRLEDFRQCGQSIFKRVSKGKEICRDVKPLILDLEIEPQSRKILLAMSNTASGGIKPVEVLTHVFGIDPLRARAVHILKTDTLFA